MARASLAGETILLILLLIPGYTSLRSYLWANVSIDTTSRLYKLILLAIGGFGSLAGLYVLNSVIPIHPISLNFTDIPTEMGLSDISELRILQVTNLIILQAIVGGFGGILVGAAKYVLIDLDNPTRKELHDPWEELYEHVSTGDDITVITRKGEKITGKLEQKGHPSDEHNILLSNPEIKQLDGDEIKGNPENNSAKISYHDPESVVRIEAYKEPVSISRGWVTSKYMFVIQKGCDYKQEPKKFISDIQFTISQFGDNESNEEIDVPVTNRDETENE